MISGTVLRLILQREITGEILIIIWHDELSTNEVLYMPRIRRQLSSTNVYHIMIRGNEKKDLFLDDHDRNRFIRILSEKTREKQPGFRLLAYCLMDNHVHFLFEERAPGTITKIMQGINITYAYYFNHKYERVGHLFQDRYKSEPIENDRHLIAAVRYIHNNPVEAGIVDKPQEFHWSSYLAYTVEQSDSGLIDTSLILSLFAGDTSKARTLFKEFSDKETEDVFMDLPVEIPENRYIWTVEEAVTFINDWLREKGETNCNLTKNKGVRNHLIKELKLHSTLTNFELATVLGINRNIVQRIK